MKIGNHPSDQCQPLLPRAWIYDYIALTPFICIPPIQQCGLECATSNSRPSKKKKNCSPEYSSWAVPNPLNAINPAFAHSTSLSLYFSTFLHGEAWLIWLSRMGDREVGEGVLGGWAKCLEASHKLWHRQMARAGSDESFDFWNIAAASFQMSGLVMPFLLLDNTVTSTSVLLRPAAPSWSKVMHFYLTVDISYSQTPL